MIQSSSKVTVVIGATNNPERYSFKALHALLNHHLTVIPLGVKNGSVGGLEIINDKPKLDDVDTVTLYINSTVQKSWEDYILSIHPKRIIFNPGTENIDFMEKARKQGIEVLEACTLVLLATNQY